MDNPEPLTGLRVVELSSFVATPLCGLVLGQLGADVIRIEPLGGAPDRDRLPRSPEGRSLYWAGLNKGKRGVAVDLSSAKGRELVAELMVSGGETGGIVISNNDRYPEFSYKALAARRPDVIHVLLNGMHDGSSAVDYTIQAMTGFPLIQGPEDAVGPVNSVVPSWDLSSGLYLAIGILAAERRRRLTGAGSSITLSLEDVALATAGSLGYLAEAQLAGVQRTPSGNDIYGMYGRDFTSGDGVRFMLAVVTSGQWRKLVEDAGLAEAMAKIERENRANFADEAERYRCRGAISQLFEPFFGAMTWDAIRSFLADLRIPVGRYQSFNELWERGSTNLVPNPLFSPLQQHGVANAYQAPGLPLAFDGRYVPALDAPTVGEHTDEVLMSSLGLTAQQVSQLRAEGLI